MNKFDTITQKELKEVIACCVDFTSILHYFDMEITTSNQRKLELFLSKNNIMEIRKAPHCLLNIKDEEFIAFWNESISYAEVSKKVKYLHELRNNKEINPPKNRELKKYAQKLNLQHDHMLGQGHAKGKRFPGKFSVPLEDVMTENSHYNSRLLKERLIENNYLEYMCVWCKNKDVWNNKELTLQMDHIDGKRTNQKLENLRILCPTCHSYTHTFRGKNIKSRNIVKNINEGENILNMNIDSIFEKVNTVCKNCGDETHYDHNLCNSCAIDIIKDL